MLAGFGQAEWTPPLGTELAGYGYYLARKAEWVDDPLFVRAAAFSEAGETCLLICCDCLGLDVNLTDRVKDSLKKEYGIPPDHVMIVSIHTHTGPAIKHHFGCGNVNLDYVKCVPDKIMEACRTAIQDLSLAVSLSYVQNPLARPCAFNRAFAENPVDDQARFFKIQRTGKKPMLLASYACHPVCRGVSRGVSADYPGAICKKLNEKGYDAMYLNGLCGGINPIRDLQDKATLIQRFADTVLAAMEGNEKQLPLRFSCGTVEDRLCMEKMTREDISAIVHQANERETEPPGGGRVAREWAEELLEMEFPLPTEETFQAHYLVLGGVPIVSLPFEGFTLTGMLIREALKDNRTLVLGCQEEMLGYLPTMDDYDRHSYAARDAFFLYRRVPTLRGEAERIGQDVGKKLAQRLGEGEKA